MQFLFRRGVCLHCLHKGWATIRNVRRDKDMESSILYTEKRKNMLVAGMKYFLGKHSFIKRALVWTILPIAAVTTVALATGAAVLPIAFLCGWI